MQTESQPQSAIAPAKRPPGPQKLSYTHEAMIDLILQEPTVTTKELGAVFDLSPGWVARVIASDSFQSRLAERKQALVDPVIVHSIRERVQGVAVQSLTIIKEKLDAEESAAYALEALGVATIALGGRGAAR